MHVSMPASPHGFLLVCDVRNKADAELDIEAPGEAPHVLELWKPGREALGRDWKHIPRIALFDHGDTPSNAEKEEARNALRHWVRNHDIESIAVLQTRSVGARGSKAADEEGLLSGVGTVCWDAFRPCGSIADISGCIFDFNGIPVCGVLNPVNYEWVYGWLVQKQLQRAAMRHAIATPREVPFAQALEAIEHAAQRGGPISVDIESVPSTETLTVVGLAAGSDAIAVPWDSYETAVNGAIRGSSRSIRACVKRILESEAPKVGHNFVASDAPALAKRGITLRGFQHDTMIMYGLAFPQFRKGLQHACASLFPVPPWKTAYKPAVKNSATAEYWSWDHNALCAYNRCDSFYTLRLFQELSTRMRHAT